MTDITVDPQAISRLGEDMQGDVLGAGDDDYDQARRVWNAMADRHPAAIAHCAGATDVARALDHAREQGLPVAVRGGGHSIPGFSTCDGGLVVDLGPMKGIQVDPETKTVRAEGGVRWGELDHQTQRFGLATTGGVVSTTGIAGLTLGGGRGWLMRAHGLACDNLVAADVVCADGSVVRADTEEHPDLFWGLRGGGGNFGIVTSFTYRLHEVGPVVAGGSVAYEPSRARSVLGAFREQTVQAPDELSMQTALMDIGNPVAAIAACYAGPVEEGERLFEPLRRVAPPLADALGQLPYVNLQSALDGAFPPGQFHYTTSRSVDDLTDNILDLLVEHWAQAPRGPTPWILVEHMGGAVARVPADATAYGDRHATYEVSVWANWTDPQRTDDYVTWTRTLAGALDGYACGGYVNYIEDDGERAVRTAYGQHYGRLQALKDRYDPDNIFRFNQNIRPSQGGRR